MDACAAVYVKDAASATSVKGNLGEAAVKSALVASGAPAPTTVSAPVEKAAGEAVSSLSASSLSAKTVPMGLIGCIVGGVVALAQAVG